MSNPPTGCSPHRIMTGVGDDGETVSPVTERRDATTATTTKTTTKKTAKAAAQPETANPEETTETPKGHDWGEYAEMVRSRPRPEARTRSTDSGPMHAVGVGHMLRRHGMHAGYGQTRPDSDPRYVDVDHSAEWITDENGKPVTGVPGKAIAQARAQNAPGYPQKAKDGSYPAGSRQVVLLFRPDSQRELVEKMIAAVYGAEVIQASGPGLTILERK